MLKKKNIDFLLQSHEPAAYECERFGNRPVLFCCEHASNRIPDKLNNLGLSEDMLQTHIAWDIGAGELSRRVAKKLNATSIRNNYSRLVVDCNRSLSDPSAFIEISDHIIIKGNTDLVESSKEQRANEIFHPYHDALKKELSSHLIGEQTPVMISIHSFTPALNKQEPRRWHAGILWDKDPRLPVQLLTELSKDKAIIVGDNQPYSGRHIADYSIDHHAELNGYAHVCVEVRQDLLSNEPGIQEWTDRMVSVLGGILEDKNLYKRL